MLDFTLRGWQTARYLSIVTQTVRYTEPVWDIRPTWVKTGLRQWRAQANLLGKLLEWWKEIFAHNNMTKNSPPWNKCLEMFDLLICLIFTHWEDCVCKCWGWQTSESMWQLESYQMLPGQWVNSWSSSSSGAWRSWDQNNIIHFWWLVLNSALRHFTFCQTIILWLWAKCLPIFPSVGRHMTSNNSLCKHHSLSKYLSKYYLERI